MFCGKCGAELKENAKFCSKCGNVIDTNGEKGQSNSQVEKYKEMVNGNKKNKTVGMIAVGVVVLILVVAVFCVFGGRSYKKTIKEYVKASFNSDSDKAVDKIVKLLPEEVWEKTVESGKEEGDIDNEEEAKEFLAEKLEESYETIEEHYGEGFKYSYEIVDEDELRSPELEAIEDDFKDEDIRLEKEITEGKEVTVKVAVKSADGKTTADNELNVTVIKIGRSWYLADFDF